MAGNGVVGDSPLSYGDKLEAEKRKDSWKDQVGASEKVKERAKRGGVMFESDRSSWQDKTTVEAGGGNPVRTPTSKLNPKAEMFQPRTSVASVRQRKEPARLSGKICGVSVKMLCDSGAESTILSRRYFDKLPRSLREQFQDRVARITMANGDEAIGYGPVHGEIEVNGQKICEVVVIADIPDEAILGWDAQVAFGVRYEIGGVDLVSSPREGGQNTTNIRRVQVGEACVIPPRSEAVITGRWDTASSGETLLISGLSDATDNGGLMVARSLVNGDKLTGFVRVLNMTDNPRKLDVGEVIASVEEVTVVGGQDVKANATVVQELPDFLKELHAKVVAESELNTTAAEGFAKLLSKHQKVFAKDDNDLGHTDVVKHHVDTGDARPIRQPPRRLPMSQQEDCEKEVQSMLQRGVIEPGQSPWSSPVVLVKKKDGSLRFCVDYRKLNAVTKFDAYPLPRIEETFEALGGAKWFTTLDLISGYWQVGLTPEAKLKSAFCTRSGLYLWKVMPFGLCNAPSTFERLMEGVLQGLQWHSCLVYLDDVVVYGRCENELLTRMGEVFERLEHAGLKLKPRKCRFFARETEYLGHVISEDGVKVNPEKVKAVREWPVPQCVTEVRSFLGTTNYYRRFVKGYASIAAPLSALTGGDAKFEWTAECQQAFERLKNELCNTPVLAFPVAGAKFILDTDACDRGIGAVLSQLVPAGADENGEQLYDEHVLSYASRTLNVHEKNYCTTRKEMLAVVWFVRYFRPYLYGREFIVRTDHSSLRWLYNFWEPEGQVARWLQVLGEYNFVVVHREGKRHGNADGLSRQGICKSCKQRIDDEDESSSGVIRQCPEQVQSPLLRSNMLLKTTTLQPEWTPNQLAVWQEADDEIKPVLIAVREQHRPTSVEINGWPAATKRLVMEWDRLRVVDGVLFREWYSRSGQLEKYQLVAPRQIRALILSVAHEGAIAGHYSDKKTVQKVREWFYWPKLATDARDFGRSCEICQKRKAHPTRPHHPLQQDTIGEPMQKITIDLLGFDQPTDSGYRYLLVVVDSLTKWVEAVPLCNMQAETVARALVVNVVCRLGVPTQIHSDMGGQFESAVFQQMCVLLGIRKTRTTPGRPQSDGQTERANRTLLELLAKAAADDPQQWDIKLPYVLASLRSTPSATTGETPNRLMLGREVVTPLTLLAPPVPNLLPRHPWVEDLHEQFASAHSRVQEAIGRAQRVQKKYYDKKVKEEQFVEGQRVWLWNMRKKPPGPHKLNAGRWEGPLEIKKRISVAVYLVGKPGEEGGRMVSTAHLVPYIERRADLQVPVQDEEVVGENVGQVIAEGGREEDEEPAAREVQEGEIAAEAADEGADEEMPVIEQRVRTRPQRTVRRPAWMADFAVGQE